MSKATTRRLRSSLMMIYMIAIGLFILAPNLIVIVMSFNNAQYFLFPPKEYSLRWYSEAVVRAEWRQAFFNSLWIAVLTAFLSTVVGALAGIAIHRGRFRGREALSAAFLSPLMMPQLLLGIAMLFFLARLGLNGTLPALLMGHVLVTFPFVLRLILSALPTVSVSLEEAALTMGANELTAVLRITLPIIRSAVVSGWLFAFILSFDNVMISLFLTSPRMTTLPVKILHTIEATADPTIAAISSIFMVFSLGLMMLIDRTVGLQFKTTFTTGS